MRQMQPVLWTKGVLLTPQHLQVQDQFLEDLLEFQRSALAFAPWGFSRLELDREALASGTVALAQAAGILPDGLPFDAPGADALPPPRSLEGHMHPDRERVTVWLGLPERRSGGWNVAPTGGPREVRYSAEVVLRRDENTGLQEKPVQVARKNFRILFEGESLEGHSVLPVARLRRRASGGVELDSAHVPPLLDISASEVLGTISRRLVELLTARSSSLSGARRQRNKGLAEFGVSDVASFWLLYTVNTHLPVIRHLHETRKGHPAELFEAMLALAGALTTFSATLHPRDLPVYDHTDPGRAFLELDARIRELLETVVPSSYVSLPLKVVETTVHAAALDDDTHLSAPRWYLAVAADLPERELLARVPQLLKVASGDQVERLIRQALPGLKLVHDPDPPSQVPVRLDYHYFRVEKAGPVWEGIRKARNVAVHVPGDFPDARLELGILLA